MYIPLITICCLLSDVGNGFQVPPVTGGIWVIQAVSVYARVWGRWGGDYRGHLNGAH